MLELTDGRILSESDHICDYVQESSQDGVNLYPGDTADKYLEKVRVNKVAPIGLKILISFLTHENRTGDGPTKYKEGFEELNSHFPSTDSYFPYLAKGSTETMADIMLLPFIHRAFLVANTSIKDKYFEKLDFSKIQNLVKWYQTLAEKYSGTLAPVAPFTNHLEKNIAANGPKVQLHYPLDYSEKQ